MSYKQYESAPLNVNAGEMAAYSKALSGAVDKMRADVERRVLALYGREKGQVAFDGISDDDARLVERLKEKYKKLFDAFSISLALKIVREQLRSSSASVKRAVGEIIEKSKSLPVSVSEKTEKTVEAMERSYPAIPKKSVDIRLGKLAIGEIPGKFITPENRQIVEAAVSECVSQIRSIPERYFTDINGAVMRSISGDLSEGSLKKSIESVGGVSKRRAQLIAHDQTRKLYQNLNFREFQRRGIKKFKWKHHAGSREPRLYHEMDWPRGLNNGVFELEKPPVIDKRTGERGYPGQLPYCRCTMAAVVEFED